jgi:hypothetical protein
MTPVTGDAGPSAHLDLFEIPNPPCTKEVDDRMSDLHAKLSECELYASKTNAEKLSTLLEQRKRVFEEGLTQASALRQERIEAFRQQLRKSNYDPDCLKTLATECRTSADRLEEESRFSRSCLLPNQDRESVKSTRKVIEGLRAAAERFERCIGFLQGNQARS